MEQNKIYCLIGPSGTGKDAIKNQLVYPHIVSYRTRKKRDGEVEGIDGYFITPKEYFAMEKENLWIADTFYSGNYYGITQGEILPLDITPIVYVVDLNGAVVLKEGLKTISGYSPEDVVTIFIDSNREEVFSRMVNQGRDEDEISKRMQRYDVDMEARDFCDYIVKNERGKLTETVCRIYEIIAKEQTIGATFKGVSLKEFIKRRSTHE